MINSVRILRNEINTPTVNSLYFHWDVRVEPGQFVMTWVPGLSEIPMSLSLTGKEKCLTVKKYGDTSNALSNVKPGERIFFRGPYGKPFSKVRGKTLLVGGGSGMASLRPLIDQDASGVVAARSSDELLFKGLFPIDKIIVATDDGSEGIKGNIVDALRQIELEKYEMIYVCGPERMIKSVVDFVAGRNINMELSLERNMKCGVGICDSCSIDGFQLCTDGPTFGLSTVLTMKEFGRTKLAESGKRIWFQ